MKFIYVIKEYIKMAFKSLRYVYTMDKRGTVLKLGIVLIFPILTNVINIINARLTDSMQKSFGTSLMQYVLPVFSFLIIFTVLNQVFQFLSNKLSLFWNRKLNQMVYTNQLIDKKNFTIPFIDSSDSEELYQRINFSASSAGKFSQVQLVRGIPSFISIIINLAFAIYIAYSYSWFFATLIVLSSLPGFYFLFVRVFAGRRNFENNLELNKYYNVFSSMFSSYQGLKDAKSSNNSDKFIKIYKDGMEKIVDDKLKIENHYINIGLFTGLLTTSVIFIIQFFVIKDVVAGSILIGQATLIILQVSRFEAQLNDLSIFLPEQYEHATISKYLFLQSETKQNKDKIIGEEFSIKNDIIEFKDIHFKYEDTRFEELHELNREIDTVATKYFGLKKPEIIKKERDVSNFNMHIDKLIINKGERIAVVGKNGNGKTTFIQLLLNIYKPQSGDITLYGNNIKDLSQETIMSNFSALYQDYSQPSLKVHEYIGLSEKNEPDMNRIKSCAKLATADDFIEKWDNKYTQQMGVFMKGVKPSKGQWQKLALARTFYKDSPIVILDEPTASIDAISSKRIFENLKQIPKDKTIILISHNMIDIVDFADRIIVFEDGRIIGDGPHKELLKSCKIYKELYESEVK